MKGACTTTSSSREGGASHPQCRHHHHHHHHHSHHHHRLGLWIPIHHPAVQRRQGHTGGFNSLGGVVAALSRSAGSLLPARKEPVLRLGGGLGWVWNFKRQSTFH